MTVAVLGITVEDESRCGGEATFAEGWVGAGSMVFITLRVFSVLREDCFVMN
jgi:hypothetical protein